MVRKKFGIDTKMQGYLDLKDEESRRLAQMAKILDELQEHYAIMD